MVHHDKPTMLLTSESSFKLSIPVIGSTRWKSPTKMLLELPGINQRTNLITPRPRRVRVLPSLNRRTQICLPARPQAKEAPQNPRSQIPTYHPNLGKTASLPLRKGNAVSTKTFVSSAVHQDIWLKIVQKALPLLQNLMQPQLLPHPSLPQLQNLRNRKRLSNPWDYAQPKDCAELPHAKIVTLGTSTLYDQDSLILSLTSNSIPDSILKSLMDSRSSDSFINSDFVQTQHLLTHNILPI